ncbi:GNAT family N-acetyltransferase [Vibrio parahaemolyticus]|nr:GNAT family N-acetyltransferase [Vibrio parahaemolyticus]MDF5034972.1 GNAT family N-acetyltransferase [Vibrio parahaemolyticus]MDF5219701.1 GNAT family N-acetyltransferase [Vibrio parahaemolyticus]MDF5684210.1 GNAT family N-acetyltransferase [Vibrio parahaemolyticus]
MKFGGSALLPLNAALCRKGSILIYKLTGANEQFNSLTKIAFDELRTVYKPTELARKQKSQSSETWESFGYFLGKNLAGCLEAKITNEVMNVRSLAVAKDYRRQGIARKLIDGVLSEFTAVKTISVWCVEQTGNVTVFEQLGFKVTQRLCSELFELPDGSKAVEVNLTRGATA